MGLLRQQNVWKCDHCGKEGLWGNDWRSKLVCHMSGGPGPWDETLVACSQECQAAIDHKRRWKKPPDKSNGEPAVEIGGAALVPNGEVRGASRPAGEASSAEGATSTMVLEGKGD